MPRASPTAKARRAVAEAAAEAELNSRASAAARAARAAQPATAERPAAAAAPAAAAPTAAAPAPVAAAPPAAAAAPPAAPRPAPAPRRPPRPLDPRPGSKLAPAAEPEYLCTVVIALRDKRRFDRYQHWLSLKRGYRVRQWEVVQVLLDEAIVGGEPLLVAAADSFAEPAEAEAL